MRRANNRAPGPARAGLSRRHGFLLDVNVLIALAWPHHVHHDLAHQWFAVTGHISWCTCPFTQLAFIRISSNAGIIPDAVAPSQAQALLERMVGAPGHRFVAESIAPSGMDALRRLGVIGHRQVSDAYLLAVALHHGVRLATLDRRVATLMAEATTRDDLVEVIA